MAGMMFSTVMVLTNTPILGPKRSGGVAPERALMVKQFQEALGNCIAGGLLLEAVAPQTAVLYIVSLCALLQWKSETKQPEVETVSELDDCLARWIQQNYEAWRDGHQSEGRQLCVLARCGLLLIRPRLGGMLRTSGRCWKPGNG